MRSPVPVPPDPFVPDRIAFGLTARQLAVVTATGLVVWALFLALAESLTPAAAGAISVPLASLGLIAATHAPDGTPMDRFLLRALSYLLAPKLRVLAPEGLPARRRGRSRRGVVDVPIVDVSRSGFVEMPGETAALLKASGINLRLRADAERSAVSDAFGRLLNSLDGPVQFLVSSTRTDAEDLVASVEAAAPFLPHRLLTESSLDFCSFFRSLAQDEGLLRRRMLVCLKERSGSGAEVALIRRADQIGARLREAGIRAVRLEGEECRNAVLEAADPDFVPIRSGQSRGAP